MKGLLYKEFFILKKQYWFTFLIAILFAVIALLRIDDLENGGIFFLIYPFVMLGGIAISLQAYDEAWKWNVYCKTLPYTPRQVVLAKYLTTLLSYGAFLLLFAVGDAVNRLGTGQAPSGKFFLTVLLCFPVLSLVPAVGLPIVYRFGLGKGRLIYFVLVGVICGSGLVLIRHDAFLSPSPSLLSSLAAWGPASPALLCAVILLVTAAMYLLSYLLSVRIYKRQEI